MKLNKSQQRIMNDITERGYALVSWGIIRHTERSRGPFGQRDKNAMESLIKAGLVVIDNREHSNDSYKGFTNSVWDARVKGVR